MLEFSYGRPQPDFQRVCVRLSAYLWSNSIFLLVYDIAIKSGCHLTKLISAAAASESEMCLPDLSSTSVGTSSSKIPVHLSGTVVGVSWKRDQ